jgi:diadenosine tetraphosphate (Ap4A) HIT family hydrolase
MNTCKLCNFQPSDLIDSEIFTYWRVRPAEKEKNCPGYHYIEFKTHVETYLEVNSDAWKEYGMIISNLTSLVYNKYSPLKIYTISISEAVPHLHFHFVPRYLESPIGFEYLQLALTNKIPI